MNSERLRALKLWIACTVVLPILWIMQLGQALLGNTERSINMACALDACGNALFGGDFRMTISERVGLAAMAGKRWAPPVARIIDAAFGAGHCADEARQWILKYGKGETNA